MFIKYIWRKKKKKTMLILHKVKKYDNKFEFLVS